MTGYRWFIGLKGLFIFAIGVLFVTNPGTAAAGLAFYLGLILVIGGAVSALYAWQIKKNTGNPSFGYLPSMIVFVGGCLLLFFPTYVLSIFAFAIGLWILIDGFSQIKMSANIKNYGKSMGNGMVIMGALSLVIGILIVLRPYDLIKFMTALFGIILLITGSFQMFIAAKMK